MSDYQPQLHIVLHQPEIPQNAGNVGRTCVALGAKLWLVRPLGFRLDERALRRAGLDYWDSLVWEAVDDWNELVSKIDEGRMWFFTKKAKRLYSSVEFQVNDVLVFGSETQGLPPTMLEEAADRALRIPIRSPVRSLNLASSVAVAGFEALRQWGDGGMLPES